MSFATRFIYVGLGGTGLKIGRQFEQLLREEVCGPDGRALNRKGGSFGGLRPRELPSFIQSLYIDFSEQDLVSLQNELLPQATEVALKTATFVKALSTAGHSSSEVTNLLRGSVAAQQVTDSWLPPKQSEWGNEPTFAPLSTGAGQYPTIGRAALFAYMERFGAESLLRDLRRPFAKIVSSIGQLEEYAGTNAASRNVVLLVGCSVSGGTGAGLLLDICRLMAHVASDQLGETPFTIVPLILLPSAFDNVLAPSKRNSASLNAIRALADLGRLIDSQNAPNGDDIRAQLYPGGEGGNGTIQVVLPPAAIKTAYLFHRPADVANDGLLAERVAWFAANLVRQPSTPKSASGPLGSGRVMTLLDRLVNNSGLLQERHPTFIGRRPFASATCVAIRDGREEIVELVAEDILREYLQSRMNAGEDQVLEWAEAFEEAVGLKPPTVADIDQRIHSALLGPSVVVEENVRSAYRNYKVAINNYMTDPGKKLEGGIPEGQSAGADRAFERAAGMADATGQWTEAALRATGESDVDFLSILLATRKAAHTWQMGGLVAAPPARVPLPDERQLISRTGGRLPWRQANLRMNPNGVRQVKEAEASQIDATWRAYLLNQRGPSVKFRTTARDFFERLNRVERVLLDWQETAKEANIVAREASIRERYAYAQNYAVLKTGALRQAAATLGIADTSAVAVVKTIIRNTQSDIVEVWRKSDNLDPHMLPSRLLEVIRNVLARVFEDPDVYVGITQILQRWAAEQAGRPDPEVRQFRTKMLASISDSLVPPTLDRDIEAMVTIAYPGDQQDSVETKLQEALSTHTAFASFLRQSAPTFVPNAAGNAVVVSVSLVGQGLIDIEGGAESLNRWIESAFRPDPTDRLAFRQREGYRDPIDFIDQGGRAEMLQRLLAAAWNNQLIADRVRLDGRKHDGFKALHLRFGAQDAAELEIKLEKMPFAQHLAPLVDAYLREISRRYASDSDTVSEILRELSRAIPEGFVERRAPTEEDMQARRLFLDLALLDGDTAANEERTRLRNLLDDLKSGRATGSEKRVRQIEEYLALWDEGVATALNLSFGTLGYGSFAEVFEDLPASFRAPAAGR